MDTWILRDEAHYFHSIVKKVNVIVLLEVIGVAYFLFLIILVKRTWLLLLSVGECREMVVLALKREGENAPTS